jgi:hypothetical protein
MLSAHEVRLDVIPFREEALRQNSKGVAWSEMCRRAGLVTQRPVAETSFLKRRLGLVKDKRNPNKTVSYSVALKLCEALNLSPVDMGL